ncbi:hypothetical protein Tco_0848330 [Tanacetum coccineum]
MHVNWASDLIIPKGIIHDIQQLICGFCWCNGEYKRGKAKVDWDDICLPRYEGGLGICSLELFNIALMTTHIWNIVTNNESLWVRWTHTYKLKGRTFWDIPLKADTIGDGLNFSSSKILWRAINGNMFDSSVKNAWDAFRPRGVAALWQWDVGVDTGLNLLRCTLCDSQPDSHAHLFFECSFSSQVWMHIRCLAGMELIPPILQDILMYLQPMENKRTIKSVIGRLLLVVTSYYIWLERNNRMFKNVKRSSEKL